MQAPSGEESLVYWLGKEPPESISIARIYINRVSNDEQTRVGKILAGHCAGGLKKLTLELGGNCPFLVFDDANLEQACEGKSAYIPT